MTFSLINLLKLLGLWPHSSHGNPPPSYGTTPPSYGSPESSTLAYPGSSNATISTLSTTSMSIPPNSDSLTNPAPTEQSTVLTTTLSNGQTATFTLPSNITSTTLLVTGSETVTFVPPTTTSESVITSVDGDGQTIISNTDGVITVPTGLSMTTNSEGLTIITSSGGAVTVPSDITIPITTTDSNGAPVTINPPEDTTASTSGSATSDPASEPGSTSVVDETTIISNSNGIFTVPTGLAQSTVITNSDGLDFTFVPSSAAAPTTQSASNSTSTSLPASISVTDGTTIVSNTGGIVTIPTGLTESTVLTNSDGAQFTWVPSDAAPTVTQPSPSLSSAFPSDSISVTEGTTIISNTDGVVTVPTGLTEATTLTNSDGSQFTFVPPIMAPTTNTDPPNTATTLSSSSPANVSTSQLPSDITATDESSTSLSDISTSAAVTTDSDGQSTTANAPSTDQPTTTPFTTTDSNGQETTVNPPTTEPPTSEPTSTSTETSDFLVPVTTSVDQPKPTDDGSLIPCNSWFFNTCIQFWDIDIFGWVIDIPPGEYPPGPPPPFTIDPEFPITLNTIGPLPTWPAFTIGPDRMPTFPPKPSGEPDGECETESAEICATMTSYGVSVSSTATTTTTSEVLSTCATVYGCNVEDQATSSSTTSAASCTATADLGWETGLCDNGRFPLYDAESNSINCDVADDDIPDYLTGCQEDADNFGEYSLDEIECLITCPANENNNAKRGLDLSPTRTTIRSIDSMDAAHIVRRQDTDSDSDDDGPPPKRPRLCPPAPPPTYPGQVHPGRTECDVVFQCDTDLWPNVCNNAKSAQVERAKPTVLAYTGDRQDYVTQQWWRTHAKRGNTREDTPAVVAQRDAGTLPGQPHGGWGLIGCEVEEYPFGNSLSPVAQNQRGIWDNRAVLRLVPWEENRDHGNALGRFIAAAQRGDPNRNLPALSGQWTYCVDVTGGNIDSTDYLLGQDQSGNRCGQAYGPGFLLVNDISAGEARQHPNERRWDPWFDDNNQLFDHTIYSSGQSIATTALPSQYGLRPAPGLKTFIRNAGGDANSGTWSTVAANGVTVGAPEASGVPGARGQNLKYDDPASSHPGIWKRSIDIRDLGLDPRHPEITPAPTPYVQARRPMEQVQAKKMSPPVKRSSQKARPRLTTRAERFRQKRQSVNSGSYLDARVYREAFLCPAPELDGCTTEECWEGGVVYDADGNVAESGSADQSGPNGEGTGDETLSSSSSIASSTDTTSSSPSISSASSSTESLVLPTLTGTAGISTPSGSSCASTAPVTLCNGSGGQSVCETTSSCASWVNTATTSIVPSTTTSSPTTTTSRAPLFTSPVVCNNEADFPGHADIQSGDQEDFGREFCNEHNTNIYPVGPNLSQQYEMYTDGDGVNYEYRITYISGCLPEGYDHQNTYSPQMDGAGITCPILMRQAYTLCNNGGVGGSITVGCLIYEFIGARGDN